MTISKTKIAILSISLIATLILAGCSSKEAEPAAPDTPTADQGKAPSSGSEQSGASSRPAFNMEDQK